MKSRSYHGKLDYEGANEHLQVNAFIVRDDEIAFDMASVTAFGAWAADSSTPAKLNADGVYVAESVGAASWGTAMCGTWRIEFRITQGHSGESIDVNGEMKQGGERWPFSGTLDACVQVVPEVNELPPTVKFSGTLEYPFGEWPPGLAYTIKVDRLQLLGTQLDCDFVSVEKTRNKNSKSEITERLRLTARALPTGQPGEWQTPWVELCALDTPADQDKDLARLTLRIAPTNEANSLKVNGNWEHMYNPARHGEMTEPKRYSSDPFAGHLKATQASSIPI